MQLIDFSPELLLWFSRSARVLPWRDEPTPYHVWLSEIMLQQTRVEAVKPYYNRFLSALPDVSSLARADEDALLKLWEGLGYYNRVRNLQKAAIVIEEEYGGQLPNSYEKLLTLPGIGPYTAGAIASIAFGIPVPAVDGNVLRVISRIGAYGEDILSPKAKKDVTTALTGILPKEISAFNQAMMELGATICLPHGAPKCEMCPVQSHCKACEQGTQLTFPVKTPKKKRKIEKNTIVILECNGKIALEKRPNTGLLPGLYQFLNLEGHLKENELPFSAEQITPIGSSKHIFTHKEWLMIGYHVKTEEQDPKYLYVTRTEIDSTYPIPSALAAYKKYLFR